MTTQVARQPTSTTLPCCERAHAAHAASQPRINVSDHLLKRLKAWGTRIVYGYPGDGINGIMGAFNRNDQGIRFVQARHEEMAAFMTCAHAKFTDEVGVCLATSGPGAIHLLNGLYDAKLDHAIAAKFAHPDRPVIAFVGDGAMQMNGNAELVTIAKYWQEWSDPRFDRAGFGEPRPEYGHLGDAGHVR